MTKGLAGALGLCALSACASNPQPAEHLSASMASVRGAETAGAEQVPQAALHLKLAQEQVTQAQEMIKNGDDERADSMAIRAYNDAELALALTREAQSKRKRESYAEGHSGATSEPALRSDDQTPSTAQPAGVGAPNTPAPSTGRVTQ